MRLCFGQPWFAMATSVVVMSVFVVVPDVLALSHVTALKIPLTSPYVACGTETSTTDCTTGSMDLDSPWRFTQGTLVIDDDEVSLRLDDLELADGYDCGTDVGTEACNC